MAVPQIEIPAERISAFCRKWQITELALFGSVLREDFGSDSDVDVLVTFAPDVPWSLYDWVDMGDELPNIRNLSLYVLLDLQRQNLCGYGLLKLLR